MAINLADNIRVGQQKPLDDKYFNGLSPYTSILNVNTLILSSVRYRGLTVNINGVEYWYKDGIADGNLVVKSVDLTGYIPYIGATTTVDLGTQTIKSGNAYFYDFDNFGYVSLNGTKDRFNFINSAGTQIGYFSSNDFRMINGARYGNIQLDTLTSNRIYTLPNATGTIALTTDIPTIGTWGILDYPTWTTGTPFVKMTAAGTFSLDPSTYLPIEAGATTTTALTFTTDRVYGTIASPEIGNIAFSTTGALLGVTNIIIHNNTTTAPTFAADMKKLSGSSSYVVNTINYIFVTYINDYEIIYSINQRT